jgi:hypothetical protein
MPGEAFVQGFAADIAHHAQLAAAYAESQEGFRRQSHGEVDLLGASWRDQPYLRATQSHEVWSQGAKFDTDHGVLQSEVGSTVANAYGGAFDQTSAVMSAFDAPTA